MYVYMYVYLSLLQGERAELLQQSPCLPQAASHSLRGGAAVQEAHHCAGHPHQAGAGKHFIYIYV